MKKPPGYWKDKRNHRFFFENLAKTLEITNWTDWYNVSVEEIKKNGGSSLLVQYYSNSPSKALKAAFPEYDWDLRKFHQGSHIKLLMATYPDYNWKPWKFEKVPSNYWQDMKNQRTFLDDVFIELKLKSMEDWYKVTLQDILQCGGYSLMKNHYNFNVIKALQFNYPEYNWEIHRFLYPPDGFFSIVENQRVLFDQLAKTLGINTWENWYKVSPQSISEHGGDKVLVHYKYSHVNALRAIYPEHKWDIWKFDNYMNSHRKFFDDLFKKLNFQTWEDWYKVKYKDIADNGGKNILSYFEDSYVDALKEIYPEYSWKVWQFDRVPSGYWESKERAMEALDYVKEKLQLKSLDDWYGVSIHQLVSLGVWSLIKKYGGISNVLKTFYSNHNWDATQFAQKGGSKHQQFLVKVISEVFPDIADIHINYILSDAQFDSGIGIELDIFIPSLKLAIEYQGEHHYRSSWNSMASASSQEDRDKVKRKLCEAKGITLIEIPYWWDVTKESLIATLHSKVPELVAAPGTGHPIPENRDNHALQKPPYYILTIGRGRKPRCRGCNKILDKQDPRIQTILSFRNVENASAPLSKKTVSFCVKMECFNEAKKLDSKLQYAEYPTLTSVLVPSSFQKLKEMEHVLSNNDFTWIKE